MKSGKRKCTIVIVSVLLISLILTPTSFAFENDTESTTGNSPVNESITTPSTETNTNTESNTEQSTEANTESNTEQSTEPAVFANEVIIQAKRSYKRLYPQVIAKPQPSAYQPVVVFYARQVGSRKVRLYWNKPGNAKGYVIQRLKGKRWKTVKTIKKSSTRSWTNSRLKKGRYYQYRIKAYYYYYKKKKRYSGYSLPIGIMTRGTAQSNASYVATDVGDVSLLHNNSVKISATVGCPNGQALVDKSVRFISSNPSVASVDSEGNIYGINLGRCTVYAIAHNGFSRPISVSVNVNPDLNATEIPILTFHRIVNDDVMKAFYRNEEWVAPKSDFEKQMKYLYDNNFNVISMEEFYQWYIGSIELPENSVVLTMDDGRYETYYLVYPIVKQYHFPLTVFFVGSRARDTTSTFTNDTATQFIGRDKIEEIKRDYPLISFQSHSWNLHHYERGKGAIFERSSAGLLNDCQAMQNMFPCEFMAYPYGYCTSDAPAMLASTNIKMAFGFGQYDCARRSNYRYNITRTKITGITPMWEFVDIVNHR